MRGHRSVLLPLVFVVSGMVGCDDAQQVAPKAEKPKPAEPGKVDADAPEEFVTTESGLKYRIRRKTDGKKATATQAATIHFRGWLDDGSIFDTTYGTGGKPRSVELKDQFPGLRETLGLVGEGGMIETEVPSQLAFGEKGSVPSVPPNSTVHLLVEVFRVFDPPPPATTTPMDEMTGGKPGPVDEDAPEEFTETPSGLKYRIRRKSDGPKPTAASTVMVHYKGWLDDDKVFDQSYSRGTPTEFPLNGVIKGWTEGLQLVGEGGMIELVIPPELGYGAQGQLPAIPPNSTLHFTIELKKIK